VFLVWPPVLASVDRLWCRDSIRPGAKRASAGFSKQGPTDTCTGFARGRRQAVIHMRRPAIGKKAALAARPEWTVGRSKVRFAFALANKIARWPGPMMVTGAASVRNRWTQPPPTTCRPKIGYAQ